MNKIKKGQKLVCVPCGREVAIRNLGVAETAVWCCGRPMRAKVKAKKKTGKN